MQRRLVSVLGLGLGVAFVFFGSGKLLGQDEIVRMFQGWGLPIWLVYATGMMEVSGGILSAVPRSRFFGAGLLVLVMLGAIGTHALNADFGGMFPVAIVMLGLAVYVASVSRPDFLRVSDRSRGSIERSRRPCCTE